MYLLFYSTYLFRLYLLIIYKFSLLIIIKIKYYSILIIIHIKRIFFNILNLKQIFFKKYIKLNFDFFLNRSTLLLTDPKKKKMLSGVAIWKRWRIFSGPSWQPGVYSRWKLSRVQNFFVMIRKDVKEGPTLDSYVAVAF